MMNKRIITKDNIKRFTDQCFDRESEKASRIIKGILDAKSPRLSDISNAMEGKEGKDSKAGANYKTIQRFIDNNDPKEALHRLFDEESPYVLGDPTDIQRHQAKKTKVKCTPLSRQKNGVFEVDLNSQNHHCL
jgi:hypothetical protein